MTGWVIWVATGQAGVVINEFLPDPAGADGGYEWVELHNDGLSTIDLSGWRIEKSTSGAYTLEFTFPAGASLSPGGFAVVGEEFVAGATYTLAPGATLALGNASSNADAVRITDAGGLVIDTVVYGPNNDDLLVDDSGFPASNVAPQPVQGSSLARADDGVDTDVGGLDFLVAAVATPGASNAGGIPNCGPGPGVVINELIPNPAGTDTDQEWVELFNPGGQTIDLSGWVIASGTSTYSALATLPAATSIPSGGYLVVGQSALVLDADVIAPGFSLGNASNADAVQLRDPLGCPMDTVVYGTDNSDGWLDDLGLLALLGPVAGEGSSLSRVPNGADTDDSSRDFAVSETPTPGALNVGVVVDCAAVGAAPGLVINELVPDPAGTDTDQEWVELYNPGSSPVDVSGWVLIAGTSSFTADATLPAGSSVPAGGFLVVGQSGLIPFADVVAPGFSLGNATSNADAIQLRDCFGNTADTVVYGDENTDGWLDDAGGAALPAPKPGGGQAIGRFPDGVDSANSSVDFQIGQPTPGLSNSSPPPDCGGRESGLVVNELLTNPAGDDAGFEWVELFHAGLSPIDLTGWAVQSAGSDAWSARFTFGPGEVVNPGQFLLVGGVNVAGRTHEMTGSLGNGTGGDGVRIVDCAGVASDTVVYGGVNDDAVVDDTLDIARSVAPTPPDGGSIQRIQDGYDTNQSGLDFVVAATITPGGPNPALEPIFCEPSTGGVVINEVLPDPDGSDEGLEFVELYNTGSAPVRLDGWAFSAGTSDFDDLSVTLPGGLTIEPGAFFLIGGELMPDADHVTAFSLGNGSSSPDGVRLFDCEGNTVDTVIYGVPEAEPPVEPSGIVDDNDLPADPYGDPGSGQAIFRVADGADADVAEDWKLGRPTPGSTNVVDYGPGDPDAPGCGCGGAPPDGSAPTAAPGNAPPPGSGGCSTIPAPVRFGAIAMMLAWIRRRR
jgi:hypothetical protein